MGLGFDDYSAYYDSVDYDDSEIISHEKKTTFHLFSALCYILIFCISMPGNIFVLWVLLRERAWKTTSDILLLQLTISELCFTVILPFEAYHDLYGWIFGEWACGVIIGFYLLGLNSYALILTAMTLHRYVAVVHASCPSVQAPKISGVIMASTAMWLVCAAVSIKESSNVEARDFGFGDVMCSRAPQSFTMLLFVIYMQIVVFFLIPFIIITFCSVHIWITIRQCRDNINHQTSRLILGLSVVFFLCLTPLNIKDFIISLMIRGALENTLERAVEMYLAEHIIFPLLSLYCCLNPLLHIFGAQRFRKHLPMQCTTSSQRRDESQNLSSLIAIPHDTTV